MMDNDFEPKELLETRWKLPPEDTEKEFLNEDYLKEHSTAYTILNDLLTKVWSSDSEDEAPKNYSNQGSTNNADQGSKSNTNQESKNITNQGSKNNTNQGSKNNTNQGSKINNNSVKNNQQRLKGKPMCKVFNAYPKCSVLTVTQQGMFLELMKKFTNNHSPFLTPHEQQELQTYMVLQEKVNKEQIEYLQFLRDFAIANQSRYMSINPGIRKYINELWKTKLKAPLKYPQFYENYRTIALVQSEIGSAHIDLVPENVLLQMGLVDRLRSWRYRETINTNYEEFVAKHPIIDYENQTDISADKLKKCPVSQDKNADQLASYANIDVVISSSALKRICDNHGPLFKNPWEMAVTVKELEIRENCRTKRKRVIFIDKAFPKKKMTVVEKIIWFHKIAAKGALIRENHAAAYRLDRDNKKIKTSLGSSNVVQNEKMDNASTLDSDIFSGEGVQETFGIVESSCLGNPERSKRSTALQEIEGIKMTPTSKNKLTKGNVTEIDALRKKKQTINSSDTSDSENDKLVIEDGESNKEDKLISPRSKAMGVTVHTSSADKGSIDSSGSEESKKKPLTRSMARMLENLNKIEKLTGKNPPVVNLSTFENLTLEKNNNSGSNHSEEKEKNEEKEKDDTTQNKVSESTCSPQKGKDKKDPEKNLTVEKNKNVNLNDSPRKGRAFVNRKRRIDEKDEEETSTSPEKKHVGQGEQKRSILDELLEQQSIMLASGQKNKDDSKVDNRRNNPRRSCVLVDYDPIPPPENCNWVYRSFFLRKVCKEVTNEFKILVRYKYDAVEFVERPRMATVVPKIEFQPEFGAEAVTISELTRQWISLLIRPDSTLLRARINAFTSDIIMIEQKEIKDFLREEKLHNIQASRCLRTLYAVLRGLSDILPGQYILNHDPKMGAFVNLCRAVPEQRGNLYDLHKQYEIDSTQEEPQNISNLWIPVDVGIITPTHEFTKRVPGTFNPNTKNGGKNKKKKKKKGKSMQKPLTN